MSAEAGWAPAVFLRGGLENLFLDLALRPQFAKDLMGIGAVLIRNFLFFELLRRGIEDKHTKSRNLGALDIPLEIVANVDAARGLNTETLAGHLA